MSNVSNVNQIYKRTEVIGRGKFGIVYKGIHRATKQVYAIKVLNLDTSEDEVKDVQQEIQFLSHLKQIPNVTHYYGSYLNGTKLWIIMDYCAGGSLRTLLRPGKIEEKYIGVIVRELLIALQYIHKQNVIHRDIKAANCLITNEGRVQLCDFGVAAQLSSTSLRRNTMAGTPYWMAPEVIMEGTSYDVKADIWSLGVTIYEIATGNPPYCDKEAIRAMQLITKSKPPRLDGKQYSPLLKEIIALCLDENPQERMNAEDLLKTKFIKFYKNSPTILLKELISRYLLWREKKSSRESILMNVEDEIEENEIEVKWDFDSLSSNEYILENDINVDNIQLNEQSSSTNNDSEFNFTNINGNGDSAIYDDGDDEFMTGYQRFNQFDHTNNNHHSTNNTATYQNNTNNQGTNKSTANFNVGSTLKANNTLNRKEAPKSLLQLFEETPNEDDETNNNQDIDNQHYHLQPHLQHHQSSNYEIPKVSSGVGLHNLSSNNTNTHTSRVSTPVVEIEIPNIEDMQSSLASAPSQQQQQQQEIPKPRSRAGTLMHTQSASGNLETKKSLDPGLQRRPTLSSATTSIPQSNAPPPPQSQPPPQPQQPSSSQQIPNSLPPIIPRGTPSPKKDLSFQVNSPSKLNIITSSPGKPTMKAISSPNNVSPLLQPLNASSASLSTQSQQQQPQNQSQSQQQKPLNIKRNHQNLRLQMPTPTSLQFPKLLNTGSNLDEYSSDENVNQFGVNVSNIPLTMTPLTEKPPTTSTTAPVANATINNSSIAPKRKMSAQPTSSQQPPPNMPFLMNGHRTASSVSSTSNSSNTNDITSSTTISMDSSITMPQLDVSLFIDSESTKEKINNSVLDLLGQFSNILGLMEGKINDLKE